MSEKIYELDGCEKTHLVVYDDKVVLSQKNGLYSALSGTFGGGEKTIYFADCISIQFSKSKILMGHLTFETASVNLAGSNAYHNANTFIWTTKQQSNEKMEEVANFCRKKMEEIKSGKNAAAAVSQTSSADELKKFKELLDNGIITQDEFDAKKKQILGL